MNILEINNKHQWEEFLAGIEQKTFLHSWAWGEFQQAMGERVWRLGMYENDELVGVALVISIKAKRGKFLFVPHGPVFIKNWTISNFEFLISKQAPSSKLQVSNRLIDFLRNLARQEKCGFIRMSPVLEDIKENRELFAKLGFRRAPIHMHAELSLVLNVSQNEEEILQGMRKTTRNLIRRGEREEVEVATGSLGEFYPLFEKTAKRQGFVKFSREYLEKELQSFQSLVTSYSLPVTDALIFLAKHDGKILAGAFIVFYDDTAYYHHGASLHSKIPAAYSLQWEIIKEVKKRGIKQYNFWGVVPESETTHPWHGLSLFKRGFGGREVSLMPAQDLVLSWKYWISWGIEILRKWKRNY